MNLYFSGEIGDFLDLFSMLMALKRVQAKYAMAALKSKWKYEKLAIVVSVQQTTQNFVISRSFAQDSKEMYKLGFKTHVHSYSFAH